MHDIENQNIIFLPTLFFLFFLDPLLILLFFFNLLPKMLQHATSINGLQSTDHESTTTPPVNTFKIFHTKSTMMPSISWNGHNESEKYINHIRLPNMKFPRSERKSLGPSGSVNNFCLHRIKGVHDNAFLL